MPRTTPDPCDESAIYIAMGTPRLAIFCLRDAVKLGIGGEAAQRRLVEVEGMFPFAADRATTEIRRERIQLLWSWFFLGVSIVIMLFLGLFAPC